MLADIAANAVNAVLLSKLGAGCRLDTGGIFEILLSISF